MGCESIVTSFKIGLVDPNHELFAMGMLVDTVEKEELAIDIQKLVKQLEELTVGRPQSAIAWTTLGRVCWVSGQFKEAENAFTRAISICPTNAFYHYNLSATYSMAHFNAKNPRPMSPERFRRLTHGLRLPPSLYKLGEGQEEFSSREEMRRLRQKP
jgi:tetratricopeptide (TPR) repeat protein